MTIIYGDKDAGKTTCMLRMYRNTPEGIGFWSRKDYIGEMMVGYTLVNIVTGESRILCRLSSLPHDELPSDFNGTISQGRFLFDQSVFDWAENTVLSAKCPTKIWLDEVGRIENRGGGFAPILDYAKENNIPIVMTKRKDN